MALSTTMDIHAKPGHKVVYKAIHGSTSDQYHGSIYLKKNEVYTVDDINIGNWSTYVYLKEIPDQAFNSVLFEDHQGSSCGNKATETGGNMERQFINGAHVIYVDAFGIKHDALVTRWWGEISSYQSSSKMPGCNLVYVSGDAHKTDSYGIQMERETSVMHKSFQAAPGRYWMFADEA